MLDFLLKKCDKYVNQDRDYIFNNSLNEEELRKLQRSGLYHQILFAPITGAILLESMQNTLEMPGIWIAAFSMQVIYLRYVIRRTSANQRIEEARGAELELRLGS